MKLANKVNEVKTKVDEVKSQLGEYIHRGEETSKEIIGRFLGLFGHPEWNVEQFWNDGRRRITQAFSPTGSREGSPEPLENSEEESLNDKEEDEPSPKKLRH